MSLLSTAQVLAGNGVTLCSNPTLCWESVNIMYGLRPPSPSKKESSSPGTADACSRSVDACLALVSICPRRRQICCRKTDAGSCGTEVRAVLALLVLEVLDPRQSRTPMQTELSLTIHSGMAVSYAVPKANGEASLAQASHHGPSQITWPLPRAGGWRQTSRHRRAQGIQCWGPSQHPTPCAMTAAKGNGNFSALNLSHSRAGSCLPKTDAKKKVTPRECSIHPDRFFLINTPELGLNSNTKAIVGEHDSCRTHAELSFC